MNNYLIILEKIIFIDTIEENIDLNISYNNTSLNKKESLSEKEFEKIIDEGIIAWEKELDNNITKKITNTWNKYQPLYLPKGVYRDKKSNTDYIKFILTSDELIPNMYYHLPILCVNTKTNVSFLLTIQAKYFIQNYFLDIKYNNEDLDKISQTIYHKL